MVCSHLLFCVLYLKYFFIIILNFASLLNDRAHAIPTEICTTINPTPVSDNVTDGVVAPVKTIVSTDSNIKVSDL